MTPNMWILLLLIVAIDNSLGIGPVSLCPPAGKYGKGPPPNCSLPSDPNNLPPSRLESWFTKKIFEDLFPFANLGWGPSACQPYSYEAFVIAARYFPEFGTSSPNKVYTAPQNSRRELAAFFAHVVQETGENNAALYDGKRTDAQAADCFYRGGFYNWFEGGPTSSFLPRGSPGYSPQDGTLCTLQGQYCVKSAELNYWYPCGTRLSVNGSTPLFSGCYFGRGAIQISYNFNYGQFGEFLKSRNVTVDLLKDPNQIMTRTDPPLAMMASLWFFMTPQPPKPAMHDVVLGTWNAGPVNVAAGYTGPIFGATSLIINNECNGEDPTNPGGPGESRRIKAFKWFCKYFDVPPGADKQLSCKNMPVKLDGLRYNYSYQPDWTTTWKEQPCDCAQAAYGGLVFYYDPAYYPAEWAAENNRNRLRCVASVYDNPSMYSMHNKTSPCLNHHHVQ